MTTWVVGAAGKIGAELCNRLSRAGHEVIGIGRNQNEAFRAGRWYVWDIQQPYHASIELPQPDSVIFLAGQTSAVTARADVASDVRTNVVGLVNVLIECSKSEIKPHVITAGSVTELDLDTQGLSPIRTTEVAVSFYETAKSAQRLYLSQFARESLIDFTVLRLSNVYGGSVSNAKSRSFLDRCIRNGLRGESIRYFGGNTFRRDYLFIDDAVDAFMVTTTAREKTRNSTFDVGTGVSTSIEETVMLVRKYVKIHHGINVELVETVPALDTENVDLRDRFVDSTLFRERTGWTSKTPLYTGIEREVIQHGKSV